MPRTRPSKKFCVCCQQLVSARTEYRHRQLQAPPRVKATSPYLSRAHATRPQQRTTHDVLGEGGEVVLPGTDACEAEGSDSAWTPSHPETMDDELENRTTALVNAVMSNVSKCWNHGVCVDDYASDEDAMDVDDDPEAEEESDREPSGLNFWDELGESFERELAAIGDDLGENDKLLLRAFALKVGDHLTDDTFERLPFVFRSDPLPSWKEARSRVAFLSGLNPVLYNCCPNSCCCYVGPHVQLDRCPYCDTPRYHSDGRPQKVFVYVPLIPRLVALFRNADLATQMKYRSERSHMPQSNNDVFDGSVYLKLLGKHVTVNEQTLPHTYFCDPRDIALGISTDGFAPFRHRKATAWPLIVFNYNLPPEIRFRKENILCLGIVPGPKKPKDMDSFLWPAVEELLKLAIGIRAFDVLQSVVFALCAYIIIASGDIPAISMLLRIKGHNGFSPCRACKITGVLTPGQGKTYYVPLDRSTHPDVRHSHSVVKKYDAYNLPLRTHSEMLDQAQQVQLAPTQAESDRLAKLYGINGVSILSHLSSLSFPFSFPYDFMHLIWANLVPNLVSLWTGDYKGLDQGCESYHLQKKVWDAIGEATATSGTSLPSAFCARPPNIAGDRSGCTADSWSFWTLYLGPTLLRRKFSTPKYYNHFVDLVKLLHICLQFELSRDDITALRTGFVRWVEKYEAFYYQCDPGRLSVCTLTIHGLLHIADFIEATGPVWTSWAFPMERFCGRLQPAIKSRRFPYASIAQYIVDDARLNQIQLMHGMTEELQLRHRCGDVPGQLRHKSYESCVLLPPRCTGAIDTSLMNKILAALATRFDTTVSAIRLHISPELIEQFGKVRHFDGDTMVASALAKPRNDTRDATFVRYEVLVDKYARQRQREPEFEKRTYFGQLQHIFAVRLPAIIALKLTEPSIIFLAAIRACVVEAFDPLGTQYYSKLGQLAIIDVACLQCVVGRVKAGKLWAIIDRTSHASPNLRWEEPETE